MADEMEKFVATPEQIAIEPIQTTDIAVTRVGDVDEQLAVRERMAELAPRFSQADKSLLASQTFAQDWTEFGDNMCLSSAGAERVGRFFGYEIVEVKCQKEEFTDKEGQGYRYIYDGLVKMGDRTVSAIGIFSTRDKFLGYANKEWKPLEEIHEPNIRRAAHHIFVGNAIKSLLGLRDYPKAEWDKFMRKAGYDSSTGRKASFGGGTKGGTSKDDTGKQQELAGLCLQIVEAGYYVEKDGKDNKLCKLSTEMAQVGSLTLSDGVCVTLSGFDGDKGFVSGKKATDLKGKWLNSTLGSARKAWDAVPDAF